MDYTIRVIRLFFILLSILAGLLIGYTVPEWDEYRALAVFVSFSIGILVVLVDIMLKGFSLRGMSALTFGLLIGWLCAQLITTSPFFDFPFDSSDGANVILTQNVYLVKLSVFIILMYLGAVIALRGKDEFNLVIPYIKFVPHGVNVPLVVVDTSALIDGRIVAICASKFFGYGLVIPRFVIDELQNIADSPDPDRKLKGRKGLDALNAIRGMAHVDLRINDSTVDNRHKVDAKLIFLAQSLRAKILTTDYNLAQVAEFHNVDWLNLNELSQALNAELEIGETVQVKLVKQGKDHGQAIGYLQDGSMVVVTDGSSRIGDVVEVAVESIIPSAAGKMIFSKII